MREKYEISLWEDKPTSIVVNEGQENEEIRYYLEEKKLCVIGSDTMTSNTRAIEPKLINNVNGTNTFSFKMYYYYTDQITGEQIQNPFTALLFNERKVKVFWKDVWYDFLIKRIEEDSAGKSAVYTCEDVFITELQLTPLSLPQVRLHGFGGNQHYILLKVQSLLAQPSVLLPLYYQVIQNLEQNSLLVSSKRREKMHR